MIFQLMGGIAIAAGIFTALLWSTYQGVMQRGRLQYAHIAAAVLSLAGMLAITEISPPMAKIAGVALMTAALTATYYEVRWNRLLPLFQVAFAITLILGLPFAAQ